MKSRIYLEEEIKNKDRKFGSAEKYFPCRIIQDDGNIINAFFTKYDIKKGIIRANKNIEDIQNKSIWEFLFI